jgi:hypothetical protein
MTFLQGFRIILQGMNTSSDKKGAKTEGEVGVYHEPKESDLQEGLSFNTSECLQFHGFLEITYIFQYQNLTCIF